MAIVFVLRRTLKREVKTSLDGVIAGDHSTDFVGEDVFEEAWAARHNQDLWRMPESGMYQRFGQEKVRKGNDA